MREEIEARRKVFSANGGSSTVPSPTAWRKPATASSPTPVYRRASGAACAPPTQSSSCTRSSSEESRRRPCCLPQTPRPCCFGRCLLPVRSTCAKSMDGRHAPQSPSISQLTSPPETIPSCYGRSRHAEFQPLAGHHLGWRRGGLETSRQRFGTRRSGSDIPIVTRRAS